MAVSSRTSMVVFNWSRVEDRLVSHRTVVGARCDWGEVSALCERLSPLLDRNDRDRFAYLLRYGTRSS